LPRALPAAVSFHGIAIGPDGELLARRGAERIRCREQHGSAFVGQVLRQLADRGGFAGAVDPGHHDHRRLELADHQRLFQRTQQFRERCDQDVLDLHRPGRAARSDPALHVSQQEFCRLDAGIRQQQRAFQLLVEVVVDLRTGEDLRDVGAGLAQARTELVHPALAFGRHRRRHRDFHRRDQCGADQAAAPGRGRRLGNGGRGRLFPEETEHCGAF
jgi:hypothetical protein